MFFGDKDLNESEFEAHVLRLDGTVSPMRRQEVSLSYGDYDKAYGNYYANAYDAVNQTVELKGYINRS